MFLQSFRIMDRRHKDDPLSGQGAFIYGGRWNKPGTKALYFAVRVELAILESTIRLPRPIDVDWHMLIVEIDKRYIKQLDMSLLPNDWRDRMYTGKRVQTVLDSWFEKQESVGILVPTALLPLSHYEVMDLDNDKFGLGPYNLVLNPDHPDFNEAVIIIDNSPFDLY